jgi:raffinose/stachyose/melibiose transport system substrate-binding protein
MKGRHFTRRDFIKLSATSTAGLVLAACTPAATPEAPAEEATSAPPQAETIQLEISDFQGGQLNYNDAYDAAIELFRADHPNVELSRRGMGVDEYRSAIQPILASGDLPDIIGLYQGPDIFSAIDAGLIVNLAPHLDADAAWKNRLAKAMTGFDDFHKDGNPYAVPLDVITIGTGYHDGMVSDAGYEMSQLINIDDFATIGRAMAEQGKYLSNYGDTVASIVVAVAQQTGDPSLSLVRQAERGEVSWQQDIFLNAWKSWQTMLTIDQGLVPPDLASGIEYEQGFYDQRWWAHWYVGEWLAGEFDRNMPEIIGQVGVCNFPPAVGASAPNIWSGGPGQTLSIADKPNQAIALEFLKSLSSEATSIAFIENSVHPPAEIANPESHTDNVFFKLLLNTFNSADAFVGFSILNADVANRVIEHGGNLMLGAISPEEILADLDTLTGAS